MHIAIAYNPSSRRLKDQYETIPPFRCGRPVDCSGFSGLPIAEDETMYLHANSWVTVREVSIICLTIHEPRSIMVALSSAGNLVDLGEGCRQELTSVRQP